jgi:23S rRNA-/tRNA-specific pseudouridylate synthase
MCMTSPFTKLPLPTVLFASNHVLAVYKPPGWHSIPHHHSVSGDSNDQNNENIDTTSKCLMTHLQRCKLGGGSQQTYLKPLHRLDQPCSGIMLWGKTTKAASRLQRLFSPQSCHETNVASKSNHGMLKTYYVVVESPPPPPPPSNTMFINVMSDESHDSTQWTNVEGYLVRHPQRLPSNRGRDTRDGARRPDHGSTVTKGWSVTVLPMKHSVKPQNGQLPPVQLRHCQLAYRVVERVHRASPPIATGNIPIGTAAAAAVTGSGTLLQVRTRDGARHVIRALLSRVARMPVVGDVRYGARTALPDQSVALHAHRLQWPWSEHTMETAGFGGRRCRNTAVVPGPGHVEAPIPDTWYSWFGWSQDDIAAWERSLTS